MKRMVNFLSAMCHIYI